MAAIDISTLVILTKMSLRMGNPVFCLVFLRLDYIVVITMTGAIMSHAPDYG
jgi:hypothetical protein